MESHSVITHIQTQLILYYIIYNMIFYVIWRFGDLYKVESVAISGIHNHARPGGYLQYLVYSITSLGLHNTLKLCLFYQPFDMPPMTVGNQK